VATVGVPVVDGTAVGASSSYSCVGAAVTGTVATGTVVAGTVVTASVVPTALC
jgi:hypothetical protein